MDRQASRRRGRSGRELEAVLFALEEQLHEAPDPLPLQTDKCPDENELADLAHGEGWNRGPGQHALACPRCSRLLAETIHAWIRRPALWWEQNALLLHRITPDRPCTLVRHGRVVQELAAARKAIRRGVNFMAPATQEAPRPPLALAASRQTPREEVPVFFLDPAGWVLEQVRGRLSGIPHIERGRLRVGVDLRRRQPAGAAGWVSVSLAEGARVVGAGQVAGSHLCVAAKLPLALGYAELAAAQIETAVALRSAGRHPRG